MKFKPKERKLSLENIGWLKPIPYQLEAYNQTPCHYFSDYYGKTIHWFPTDSEEKYNEHIKYERNIRLLRENGWLNTQIDYHITVQGFRHDGTQPDYTAEKGGVLWLGDSNTFGTGVPIEQTMPYIAHHMNDITRNYRYINFGLPGFGIDTYYRVLKYYIEQVKPNYVIMTNPWISTRTEVYNEPHERWDVISVQQNDPYWENRLQHLFNDTACMMRWTKCLDAIKWLCHSNNAIFLCPEDSKSEHTKNFKHMIIPGDFARDLLHPGIKNNQYNAEVMNRVIDDVFKSTSK